MKCRAAKSNYYSEADSLFGIVVPQTECLLIEAGSYTADKRCVTQLDSSHHQSHASEIISLSLSDSLSPLIDDKCQTTTGTNHRNLLATPSSGYRQAHPEITYIFHIDKPFTTMVTMERNIASTIVTVLRFFLENHGFQVMTALSNIINLVRCVPNSKLLEESPTVHSNPSCIPSAKGKVSLDSVECNILSPKAQGSGSGHVMQSNDDISLPIVVVGRKANARALNSNEFLFYLAQFMMTLIQNKKVWPVLFSTQTEPFMTEQLEKDSSVCRGVMKKRRIEFIDESPTAKKQFIHPHDVAPESIAAVAKGKKLDLQATTPINDSSEPHLATSETQAALPHSDCSRTCDVDDTVIKQKESSRKDRKLKKKRRRMMKEANRSSPQGSPIMKAMVQSENVGDDRSNEGAPLLNNKSKAEVKNPWKLGNVDDELNAARSSINGKHLSSRNSFETSKRHQEPAHLGFHDNAKMKWKSWNAFRQDNKDTISTQPVSTSKDRICRARSLGSEIVTKVEQGQHLLREKLIRRDYPNLPTKHANDEFNATHQSRPIAAGFELQYQSAGEKPFQQLRDSQPSVYTHKDLPIDLTTVSVLPPARQIKVLCSESFLEIWGDIVAAIISGEWMSSLAESKPILKWGKISIIDSPLLNGSGIDVEVSNNCCFLVISASHLQSIDKTKDIVLKLAELAALGRYAKCYVIFYLDKELTSTMTKHMVKIQFASATSSIHVICKTATSTNLAATLAHTILSQPNPHVIEDHPEALNDRVTLDRAFFLTSLLPVASIGGSIQCLTLARTILPTGSPYFEILLKNPRLRQKIIMSTLCHVTTDMLNPSVLVQLSYALLNGRRM